MGWRTFTGSATGARHRRRGQGSEDAVATRSDRDRATIALADGVSESRCFRSARGSRAAVDTALEIVHALPPEAQLDETVGAQILTHWRLIVEDDLTRHGLSPDEETLVDRAPVDDRPWFPYATTLLVATADRARVQFLQIGDGDALVASGLTGTAWLPFTPTSGRNDGVSCLALMRALDHVRYADYPLPDDEPVAVLLATDGFDAPFVDPEWHEAVAADLARHIASSDDETFADLVRAWPESHAETGGDDTTLAVLLNDSWPRGAPR